MMKKKSTAKFRFFCRSTIKKNKKSDTMAFFFDKKPPPQYKTII